MEARSFGVSILGCVEIKNTRGVFKGTQVYLSEDYWFRQY